ncbi:MAG: WYL domain-containing protein [Cytophagales bacterium]
MSQHATIRRYTLIIEKVKTGYPSFETIKNYLHSFDFEVSARTIQRDLEQIRQEFGIEIKYDRFRKGYCIDTDNSINIESFFKFLEIVNTASLLTQSLSESKESLKYLSFDTAGGLQGIEFIKELLKAIREHRIITFEHVNFQTQKVKNFTLKPYLLKEYQNRWYVVGQIADSTDFRTFGIDRISNLMVSTDVFNADKKVNPQEMFSNTIGVVYSVAPKQVVVLSFTPTQGKYIKTLPLHPSQNILIDDTNELRISVEVTPNYELTQLILKYGNTVKVIEPQWLKEEIITQLQMALDQY